MENYSSFNARNIFEHFTPKRAMFLCIDALDFKSNGEPAPRFKVRCCDYDATKASHQRISSEVDAYIPLSKFLLLAHDVLTGVAVRKKHQLSGSPNAKYATYFEHYGGSRNPSIISTKFSLVNGLGKDADFAFLATSGPGKISTTGGIIPVAAQTDGDNVNFQSIFINMPNDTLKEFCLVGKAYAEQFIYMDMESRLNIVRAQREAYSAANSPGLGECHA